MKLFLVISSHRQQEILVSNFNLSEYTRIKYKISHKNGWNELILFGNFINVRVTIVPVLRGKN